MTPSLIIVCVINDILVQILLYEWFTIAKYAINRSTTRPNICILNQNVINSLTNVKI